MHLVVVEPERVIVNGDVKLVNVDHGVYLFNLHDGAAVDTLRHRFLHQLSLEVVIECTKSRNYLVVQDNVDF